MSKKVVTSLMVLCLLLLNLKAIANQSPVSKKGEYYTHSCVLNLRSLQIYNSTDPCRLPIIPLGGSQQIIVSFDDLRPELSTYYFQVVHCNSQWKSSGLASMEYMEGFDNGEITDYASSMNVTTLYTNFRITLPNEDFRLKLSGNYAVLISSQQDFEQPDAVVCFSIAENLVDISGKVTSNTTQGINGAYQQLNFEIKSPDYYIESPRDELKVVVMQNNRQDNKVENLQSTYFSQKEQRYFDVPSLTFQGGNSYRILDISSPYIYGSGIERIDYVDTAYQVELMPIEKRNNQGYSSLPDADGCFLIHSQEEEDASIAADYMMVHFSVPMENPYFDQSVYLLGTFFQTNLLDQGKMRYDFDKKAYVKTVRMKQGGYNYMFATRKKNQTNYDLQAIEGNFWQTQNTYVVYVYQRKFGARYDQLIGIDFIDSNQSY